MDNNSMNCKIATVQQNSCKTHKEYNTEKIRKNTQKKEYYTEKDDLLPAASLSMILVKS